MQIALVAMAIYTLVWIFTEGGGYLLLLAMLFVVAIYAAVLWGISRNPQLKIHLDEAEASLKKVKPRRTMPNARKATKGIVKALAKGPVEMRASKSPADHPIDDRQQTIIEALMALPDHIKRQSGALFYTGADAFSQPSSIYVLGLNPGGDPGTQEANTVAKAITAFEKAPGQWSAYQDDSWEGATPGTSGMQPRVLHFFKMLGLDARSVPASNVIFVRSTTEGTLTLDKDELISACWPVHRTVIQRLGVTTIICFGITAGKWVREQVGANNLIGEFRETNARRWKSQAHQNREGVDLH
ncbi:hypothetical protein [Sphingobium sp. B2]|uniref:hypothetical protein n=1 Tax=Sphingobium sp. B2 TaxID=2583228 RepID=UPI0011A31F64|nr:hypothetical protein [Sphingobium sp. B2]